VRWRGIGATGLTVAFVASGCGALLGGAGAGVSSSSCANFTSSGACTEQADRVAARHPGAVSVDLTCTVGACDRRSGSGTAVVTMPDGSVVDDVFAYVGDPAPMPAPTCAGLAPDACRAVAVSAFAETAPSRRVIAISATCNAAACTATKGDATYAITFADGSQESGGMGWDGGLP
jgi:hypothetical protein